MGHEVAARIATPLRQDEHESQRRHAREDVDNGAAGEVEHALLEQPAVDVPDPVTDRVVNDRCPQNREQTPGTELHPFGDRSDDEGRRDDCEHHLIHGEEKLRHTVGGCFDRIAAGHDPLVSVRAVDAQLGERAQEDEPRIPAEVAVLRKLLTVGPDTGIEGDGRGNGEGHVVAVGHPLDGDDRDADHHEHEHVEDVLGLHHATVEQGEAGHHEEHQRRADKDPGGRPGVVGAPQMGRGMGLGVGTRDGIDGCRNGDGHGRLLDGGLCPSTWTTYEQTDGRDDRRKRQTKHENSSRVKTPTPKGGAGLDRGRCEGQETIARPPQRGRGNATAPWGAARLGSHIARHQKGEPGRRGDHLRSGLNPRQPVFEPAEELVMQPPCHNATDPESPGVSREKTFFPLIQSSSAARVPGGRMVCGSEGRPVFRHGVPRARAAVGGHPRRRRNGTGPDVRGTSRRGGSGSGSRGRHVSSPRGPSPPSPPSRRSARGRRRSPDRRAGSASR